MSYGCLLDFWTVRVRVRVWLDDERADYGRLLVEGVSDVLWYAMRRELPPFADAGDEHERRRLDPLRQGLRQLRRYRRYLEYVQMREQVLLYGRYLLLSDAAPAGWTV